jgi:maleylacetate reductase
VRLLSRGLQRVRENPEDLQARLDCQMGMALGMTGPNSGAGVGASHAVAHAQGGNNGVAHGETSCVLLPAVMRWNLPANPDRQKLISEALGRPGLEAAVALAELINSLALPRNLREVGVGRESFSAIASRVMDDVAIRSNPRPVTTPEEVVEILELAW